jgi:hypothetical protein
MTTKAKNNKQSHKVKLNQKESKKDIIELECVGNYN